MRIKGTIELMLALGVLVGVAPAPPRADAQPPEQTVADRTPPRLSFIDGPVSFWRPGAQDWAQAQANTPLAPGDQLSTGSPGSSGARSTCSGVSGSGARPPRDR